MEMDKIWRKFESLIEQAKSSPDTGFVESGAGASTDDFSNSNSFFQASLDPWESL